MPTQRDPYSSTDALDPVYRELKELRRRVDSLENLSIPTVPKYDHTDFPQDSVEGQLATESPKHLWAFVDSEWHRIGADFNPWVVLQGNLNGVSFPSGVDVDIPLSGNLTSPLNGGGTNDPTVFKGIDMSLNEVPIAGDNEPYQYIKLMEPGLYWVEAATGWFLDWGTVQVNEHHQHSDIEDSVLQFRSFYISSSSTYLTVAGAPHSQWGVYYHQLLAVDERAVDVWVGTRVKNSSGSTRTVDNGSNNIGGGIFIVQLNKDGISNPGGN